MPHLFANHLDVPGCELDLEESIDQISSYLDKFYTSGTFLNGLLEKIHLLFRLVSIANSLIGDHLVDIVDIDEVVRVL